VQLQTLVSCAQQSIHVFIEELRRFPPINQRVSVRESGKEHAIEYGTLQPVYATPVYTVLSAMANAKRTMRQLSSKIDSFFKEHVVLTDFVYELGAFVLLPELLLEIMGAVYIIVAVEERTLSHKL
jgi:hypothetical protein